MSQRSAVPESSRKNRYWAVAALVLVAVAGAYWYFSGSSGAAKKSAGPFGGMAGMATPVSVAAVTQGRIEFSLKAIGTVTAINTVTVRSRVDGELEEIYFKEGQKVHEGDLLAQRSEEHTSALPSLMRHSYAVFCLKKQKNIIVTVQ